MGDDADEERQPRERSKTPIMSSPSPVVVVVLGMCVGCVGAEQEVVERYLGASQRGDHDTVAAVSMVVFPDEVESWNVLEITAAANEPFVLTELRQAVAAIEVEQNHQLKVSGEFRRNNYDALRGIGERLRDEPEYHFPGRLGELQDAWELHRLERRQILERLHEAQTAFELEIRRVNKSLERESSPESLTGTVQRKYARVRVTTPVGDKRYQVALSRYQLRNQFDALVPARWIVGAIVPEE